MANDKATILVVDDDPTLLDIHTLFLEDEGYQTMQAENGEAALKIIQEAPERVDAVVSDVLMPELDGYDLCKNIKTNANQLICSIPVIFVTSLTSLEEKLKGYAVGGDDYVTKPVEPAELVHKLNNNIERRKKSSALNDQLTESFNTAMQAMTYSSELGQILEFFQVSLSAENFEQLAQSLFKVTDSFGLNCSLQIHTPNNIYSFSNKGDVSPLEANIMELARHKERFYDFGARTVINYDDFSLLIKNMPLDDKDRYGRLKDTLGTLCNAIETKVNGLIKDTRAVQIKEILAMVQSAMDEIDNTFNNIQQQNVAAIEKLMHDTEAAVMHLGLLEYQEENIVNIAQTCLDKTKEVFYQSDALNEKFDNVKQELTRILGMRN